jgi:hypothetical protein
LFTPRIGPFFPFFPGEARLKTLSFLVSEGFPVEFSQARGATGGGLPSLGVFQGTGSGFLAAAMDKGWELRHQTCGKHDETYGPMGNVEACRNMWRTCASSFGIV